MENVDKVLDEVRPILVADGGNVEVVSAEDGIVQLRLQVCVLVGMLLQQTIKPEGAPFIMSIDCTPCLIWCL